MKSSTYQRNLQARDSSPDTTTVKTLTPPAWASAFLWTVETTNARATFDNTTPAAANGHVLPKDQVPQLVLLGVGAVIKWISTAGTASVLNVTWLQ